ncbi:MAG: glycosyltransferase involved in cell wall biosynthesis [Flavobacteriales bacterium]|jgi:glycosyltransferase involved in cell wall biosynthesis
MKGKRVLIITYYWPPSGGSGVQRWLKFVKYLPQTGWTPVVYTPENPELPSRDESLAKNLPDGLEVVKTKIWEPYTIYKRLVRQDKNQGINTGFISEDSKPKFTEKLSRWVRGNFFIPDARKYWIKPSISHLREYLKENPVDLIISTGPPHSMHLIALKLKKDLGIPWIADFRDPWTQIDFYEELLLTKLADNKHHRLEREVLQAADHVLVIGHVMKEEMEQLAKVRAMTALPNGFDPDDYPSTDDHTLDEKFSIAHIGSFAPSRNPQTLWKVLAALCEEIVGFRDNLSIKIIGKADHSIIDEIEKKGLIQHLDRTDYLPHDKVIRAQQSSRVLLLVVNRTANARMILTGKIFEYLNSGRPILAIGPSDGELAHLLKECSCDSICDYEDYDATKRQVIKQYEAYLENLSHNPPSSLNQFSRAQLTGVLAEIMDKVVS